MPWLGGIFSLKILWVGRDSTVGRDAVGIESFVHLELTSQEWSPFPPRQNTNCLSPQKWRHIHHKYEYGAWSARTPWLLSSQLGEGGEAAGGADPER